MADNIVSPVDRDALSLTTGLANLAVTSIAKALKSGSSAAVCIGAAVFVDREVNGHSVGRRKLLASIRAAMLKRGEKPGSFDTYSRMGQRLAVDYALEMTEAFRSLQVAGRNSPVTPAEMVKAVTDKLTTALADKGQLTFTNLREATIGGTGGGARTGAEKADAAYKGLVKGVNKLADVERLHTLARLATMRAVALATTGGANVPSVMAESDALVAAIMAELTPADTDDMALDTVPDEMAEAA